MAATPSADVASFDEVARFWRPADDRLSDRVRPVEEKWPDPAGVRGGVDVAVWGQGPRALLSPIGTAVRAAVQRERALLRARLEGLQARRLVPPHWRGGEVRDRARRALLGGAVLRSGDAPSVLDAVLDGLDVRRVRWIRAGHDGSLIVHAERHPAGSLVVRFGRAGAGTDPRAGAAALRALASAEVGPVPSFEGQGVLRDVAWSAETRLPGRRMDRLDGVTMRDILDLCRALPSADGGGASLRADLGVLAERFPHWREHLETLAVGVERALHGMPGVLRHGDLWTGNLLVRRGRLSGVVDWEGWHPQGVVGVDLLHLRAARLLTDGASMAELWLRRPWSTPRFRALVASSRDGLREDDLAPEVLEAIAVAWWAAMVASKLHRFPAYVDRSGWVREHVDAVVARFAT